MTRFTRADGSKSANKRIPDEPTPWHVMKQQLEDALMRQKYEQEDETKKTAKSAKQLLQEKDDLYYPTSHGNVNADWAEFDVPKSKSPIKVAKGKVEKITGKPEKKIKKAVKQTVGKDNVRSDNAKSIKSKKKENVNKSKESAAEQSNDDAKQSIDKRMKKKKINLEKANNDSNSSNQFKDKKRKRKGDGAIDEQVEGSKKKVEVKSEDGPADKKKSSEGGDKLSKRQKRNQKKQKSKKTEKAVKSGEDPLFNVEGNDWDVSIKSDEKKEKFNGAKKVSKSDGKNTIKKREWMSDFDYKNWKRFGNNVPKKFQKKVAKVRDDREHQHRKQEEPPVKMTINGMNVEIVKYDGYPVKKEDAERLKELRKEMVMKGIPKPDIDAAMKLERRKCEKALARIRKQVCFHCRKAGHNLSDCPELGREEEATGICFKCGSTEHTHFECKVTKSDDYRFAKCFICREAGHIAKQCPDNPKGLYPDGGCCKICGDVTHLKKDCPDLNEKKEDNGFTLDTIKNDNLESLDEIVKNKPVDQPKKKIVRF